VPSHKQDQSLKSPSKSVSPEVPWLAAYRAAESKKAVGLRVLDLRDVTTFTDFFVVCGGTNSRQIQAIGDEITLRLKKQGELPVSVEGYKNAEWVLIDYGDYIVHVFSEKARDYYDIERLWRGAKEVAPPAAE
jgi:ribosome-associated protein